MSQEPYGHYDRTRKAIDDFNALEKGAADKGLGYVADCVMENTHDHLGPEPEDRDSLEAAIWWEEAAASLDSELDSGAYDAF